AVVEEYRFLSSEEGFVLATAEVIDVAFEWDGAHRSHDRALALASAVAHQPVAGLADDEIPTNRFGKRTILENPPSRGAGFANTRGNAMHGAQPGELQNQPAAHRGDAELALPRDISIAQR